ncbi:tetratricopeptide repeat (TPR)-like superfamily protein [Artemisia annua]|uniref:Tetratricopeptide repeat (TPR)-like superfamily protein n=1 Tax=Artemisia annua TaxID=35608 RepID=A0A2U1Q4C3_ARTAN|nr:tetratricopeptide repeat (TPR)-like superfamily protein [Artemisia annua]
MTDWYVDMQWKVVDSSSYVVWFVKRRNTHTLIHNGKAKNKSYQGYCDSWHRQCKVSAVVKVEEREGHNKVSPLPYVDLLNQPDEGACGLNIKSSWVWFRGRVQRCCSEGVVQRAWFRGCGSDDVVQVECVYCPWFTESRVLARQLHTVCGCSHGGNLVPLKYSHT